MAKQHEKPVSNGKLRPEASYIGLAWRHDDALDGKEGPWSRVIEIWCRLTVSVFLHSKETCHTYQTAADFPTISKEL